MPIVQHRFLNHQISPETEILILGTFNPDVEGGPTFFYGRPRNFLWHLLPGCRGLPSLKHNTLVAKQEFMSIYRIDFVDLIASVDVSAGQERNVSDSYIDGLVHQWTDVIAVINSLKKLKSVYFTRKTFSGIPNIKTHIRGIQNHCGNNNIRFCLLETPARYVNDMKQHQWIDTIVNRHHCAIIL
ncbi:MAG: hypothetical protein WDO14_20315 [Bacteroidota bacterium]